MKRHLKNDRYQLSLSEQESVWRKIRFAADGEEESIPHRRRTSFLPALGLTSVTAVALLAVMWWTGIGEKGLQETVSMTSTPPLDSGSVRYEISALDKGQERPRVKSAESGADQQLPPPPKMIEPKKTSGRMLDVPAKDPYAVDSVEEAVTRQSGVVYRQGETYVRGGRSGEVTMQIDGVAAVPESETLGEAPSAGTRHQMMGRRTAGVDSEDLDAGSGSITGGTTPPNGETYESMYFDHAGVNPFFATEEDALSTFAVDVDNASYTVARNYLGRGVMPPKDAIRVEEFVNFFGGGYPAQSDEDFLIHVDGAPSRYGEGYHLLRVGLQGKDVSAAGRKDANLIFVIDVSGSMSSENRLGLVKRSLHVLLDELREGDSVGLVVYGSHGEVKLAPTDISSRETITAAIDALHTNGSTNAYEGLDLAYQLAREHYSDRKLNRLILCSDGVANTGRSTEAEEMLARIRRESDEGVTLSAVGFGMGNYNDTLMEALADKGDGNYYYVDELKEAERVFRENLTGTLQTIAREVKVQVEFDPRAVQRWRLLGYENRDVADRDFRNDSVDAGEVGSGHQVTALYEIKLTDDERDDLGTVRLRFEAPRHDAQRAGQVTELAADIKRSRLAGAFASAGPRLRLQAVVAEFAEILRGSIWARESTLADLVPVAAGLAEQMPDDARVQELAKLVAQAAAVAAQDEMRRNGQD